jgi:acetyl-CoA acetyltransferase
VSALGTIQSTGAALSVQRALGEAKRDLCEIEYLAIYDSFTITLALLLEEIGIVSRGQAGEAARQGVFGSDGLHPLNLHGGLLSYGHSGVAGGLAHAVEAVNQVRGSAGPRQARRASSALVHGDGGVLSAHVSLVLDRAG